MSSESLPSYDVERFLKQARQYFDVSEVDDAESLENRLKEGGARHPTVGVATEGRERLMLLELRDGLDMRAILPDVSSRQAGLDVVILHRLIFKKCMGISEEDVREGSYLRYVRGLDVAVREVRDGRAQVCFLLNPTRGEQVRDIAFAGEVLPQKSTDFFPKLLSGLTMYTME